MIVYENCYFVLVLSEAVLVLDFFDYEEEDDDEDEVDSSPGGAGYVLSADGDKMVLSKDTEFW